MCTCQICGNELNNQNYSVREMMFGTRETFTYFQCHHCGCLQIKEIPEDLSKYYPANYNSFTTRKKLKQNPVTKLLRKQIGKFVNGARFNYLGALLFYVLGAGFAEKLMGLNLNFHSKILDVGTGSGYNLITLYNYGFKNLVGIDKFNPQDYKYGNELEILRKDLFEIDEKFDFIMLNHVFEHMENPREVLQKLYSCLENDGKLMIRIPVVDCFSWRKYGVNWVALDAPRHLFLYTVRSFTLLANECGFDLSNVKYDSSDYQFWASEQYQRDIPLRGTNSHYDNPQNSIFSKKQIRAFRKKAVELNRLNDGNAACFYLQKTH